MEPAQTASTPANPDYAPPGATAGRDARPPRERLWPAVGWRKHPIVLTALLAVVFGAFFNSYQSGMTLDNKYIIEEYYKALMRLDPKLDLESWKQIEQIFSNDYWWPKGISGLYRPITTLSYWLDYVHLTGKKVKTNWQGKPVDDKYRLIDSQGRLINEKGKLMDAQGRLINAQGQVVDERGQVLFGQTADIVPPYDPTKLSWAEYTAAPGLLNCNSYHTINLVLHWVNAVLIYFVSLVLLKRVWVAAFVAALFAAHPITVESVTNIIGRADMFAAFTVFGGLLVYMRSLASRGFWRTPWLVLLMLIVAFGLFSKESSIAVGLVIPFYWITFHYGWSKLWLWQLGVAQAVVAAIAFYFLPTLLALALCTLPPVLWLIFIVEWKKPELWKPLLMELLVWCVMLPPVIAMERTRDWVFRNSSPAETPFLDNPIRGIWQVQELNIPAFENELEKKPMLGMSFPECKMTAVKIMGKLLLLLAWPVTLCSDYSYDQIPNFSWHLNRAEDWKAVGALFTLLAIIALSVWLLRKGHKAAFFFIWFFFIAAFPTSNLTLTIGSVMAERFMYLPLAGFTGVLAMGVFFGARKLWDWLKLEDPDEFPWHKVLAGSFLALVVVVYGVRTHFRNPVWKEDETLWRDAIKHSKRSFRCYQSLAFAVYEKLPECKTDEQRMAKVNEMIEIASDALPIVDPLPNHLNSSRLYLHLGMYYSIKAELLSTKAPDGSIITTPQAQEYYREAVKVLERGSQIDRAFNQVNKAKQRLRNDPAWQITDAGLGPVYGTLGIAYAKLGDFHNATQRLIYMRQLDPTDIDAYLKLASVQVANNKYDEACATLMQCLLMDNQRQQVWQTLIQIYNTVFQQQSFGAIVAENGQIKLNPTHPLVKWHLLMAYRDFIRALRWSHRFVMADEMAKVAKKQYDFPAETIDALFDEPVYVVTPEGVQYHLEEEELRGYRPPATGPTTAP